MVTWLEIARDAREAAALCHRKGHYRSAVSRAYYSMFAVVSEALRRQGLIPPAGRETWRHGLMPSLVMSHLQNLLGTATANEVNRRLRATYRKRLEADYHSLADVSENASRRSTRDAEAVLF